MSGPLLLGIAAIGVGWAYLHRDTHSEAIRDATQAGGAISDAASTVAGAVDAGIDAVRAATASCATGDTTIGGTAAVAGVSGGQVLPVDTCATEGGMVIDPNKSTGGADPSSQDSGLDRYMSPPIIAESSDGFAAVMNSRFGPSGSNGMTEKQIGEVYRESASWSNEVF